jgi:hypothetical protein
MNVDATENLFSGLGRKFREGQLEVAYTYAAQSAEAPVDGKGEAAGEPARQCPRHAAQAAGYGSNQPVFQIFQH